MPSLRELSKQERQLRQMLGVLKDFARKHDGPRDSGSVQARMQKLDEVYEEFRQVRMKTEILMEDAVEEEDFADTDETEAARLKRLSEQEKQRDQENERIMKDFIDDYFSIKQSLQGFLSMSQASSSMIPTVPVHTQQPALIGMRVKLPELKLPSFSGDLRDWITFRDSFKNLISDNTQLTDIDKFTYLRSSVSGDALQEIASIDLTAANYSIAWKSLESRYENRKLLVKSHLDALMAVSPMKKESFEALNSVISEFDKHLQMLDKIGQQTANWSTILAHILLNKLDPTTIRLWETEHRSKEVPEYKQLMEFLKNHCMVLQSVSNKVLPCIHETKKASKSFASHAGIQGSANSCPFCGEPQHPVFQCKKFRAMKVDERRSAVTAKRLCFNCLSRGHMSKFCTRSSCKICGQRHHSLLHVSPTKSPTNQSEPQSNKRPQNPPNTHTTQTPPPQPLVETTTSPAPQQPFNHPTSQSFPSIASTSAHSMPPRTDNLASQNVVLSANDSNTSRCILLATAIVILEDTCGNFTYARALLDSGSQLCFITENLSQKLKFKRSREMLSISGIGQTTRKCKQSVVARIRSRVSHYVQEETFYVLPQVTLNLPASRINTRNLHLPTDAVLADPAFNEPAAVDMIIGASLFFDILSTESLQLGDSGPTMRNTTFGWVICGRISEEIDVLRPAVANISMERIDQLLTRFWDLEECHTSSVLSLEESTCESIFDRTTIRDSAGSFIVTLPKKELLISKLGDSRSTATRRFFALERRLDANPALKQMYAEFIAEYVRLGHMKEVDNFEAIPHDRHYYIPHHCIIKPESTTTKLRVVFDASCQTSTGISLNEALMVGPTVQDDLISIVLRFRLHRYAIVADIEKMYRMVLVRPEDQNLQLIIWRDRRDSPLRVFKLCTVTYGTASAPYLATKTLKRLAELDGANFPSAAKVLSKDFYVDDMMSGVETVEEGIQLCESMQQLLRGGGFTLRKWSSNSSEILQHVPAEYRDDRTAFELDDSSATIKTLGLIWEPKSDNFKFKVPTWNLSDICKRSVISDLARIFDPIGLIGPIIISARVFVQSLWKQKVSWDEPLSERDQSQWRDFQQGLAQLDELTIPRWVGFRSDCVAVQLHGFCDASKVAYGACIYVRVTHVDGSISAHLLTSKARVAPLEQQRKKRKLMTIPRLELSSALLLAHLYDKVAMAVKLPFVKPYFWTDSEIVQYWLASSPSRWQMFVANRVSEIQHLTRVGCWNHIAGSENPADVLSRGTTSLQLQSHDVWWHGPKWLTQHEQVWPVSQKSLHNQLDPTLLEENSSTAAVVNVLPPNDLFRLKSSLDNLVTVTAWMLRFKHNCLQKEQARRRTGVQIYEERQEALLQLVKLAQSECFRQEINDLRRSHQVKSTSRLNALHPRLIEGILRVGGRLQNASISSSRKHPIILDKNHPFTTLVMLHYHHKLLHAGPQLLVSAVRERFWPLSARSLARRIVHSCVRCFRCRPSNQEQLMADLPPERVTPAPPFLRVGVDFCGPFMVNYPQRKKPPVKYFAAIFVCLVTKAVHIEAVADLTTDAFLAALRRFVARRGKPEVIMSDNATNFVGARRQLDEMRRMLLSREVQNKVITEISKDDVRFQFIPAKSPNFGGLWEAAVKSMKHHLKRSIGVRTLYPDELQTVFAQIEACLNSRPLTPLSNDVDDLEALTPGHFIIHRPMNALPESEVSADVPEHQLSRWQRAQRFIQSIWSRWSTQYLSTLHNRTKWTRQHGNLAVGTLVLIKEDHLPPLKWLLGRVIQTHVGVDGNVRVVSVRTINGIFTRAISKICPLPVRSDD